MISLWSRIEIHCWQSWSGISEGNAVSTDGCWAWTSVTTITVFLFDSAVKHTEKEGLLYWVINHMMYIGKIIEKIKVFVISCILHWMAVCTRLWRRTSYNFVHPLFYYLTHEIKKYDVRVTFQWQNIHAILRTNWSPGSKVDRGNIYTQKSRGSCKTTFSPSSFICWAYILRAQSWSQFSTVCVATYISGTQ
jgi:hypothetical protein